mgnify:CR=1 FL=1
MANILLIDDDPDVTEAGKLVLQKEGHQVTTLNSAEAGMAAIKQSAPDLLILDIMMQNPDDGINMARQLKKAGCTFPIIMLSAIGSVTGMNYGTDKEMLPAEAFIDKPVKPAALIEKVNELLKCAKGGCSCC